MNLRPLKEVAEVLVSNVDKLTVDGQIPVQLCNYTDVYYNDRIVGTAPFMTATATLTQVSRFELRAGDVLITKDSETAEDIAVPAFVPADLPGVVCGYHLASIRPRCINGEYLYYALRSAFVRQQATAHATGVTRFGLRGDVVRNLRIPVPPPEMQHRVVAILRAAEEHIAITRQARIQTHALLLERRLATMSAAVAAVDAPGERRPTELLWAPTVPAGWRVAKLTHVARLGSGHTPSRSRPDWWANCHIPWITTGEVQKVRNDRREVITETRECIIELGLANSAAQLHPQGTVVLCRTAASAGYSAVMGLDMATSQDFATWTCGPALDPFYLLYSLRAMRPYLLGYLAQGSTHRTIYMPDIESLHIPLPPIDEQQAIVSRIRQQVQLIDNLVDAVDDQLRLLDERRRALITAAVTGQLDVGRNAA